MTYSRKPENLLLGYYGEIKMADFGWSIQTSGSKQNRLMEILNSFRKSGPDINMIINAYQYI